MRYESLLDYFSSLKIFSESASVYSVKIFRKDPPAAVYTHPNRLL